ncbi:MAG: S-layer homology domain-containing protein, partial [Selenomonas sp.]|nr:S-layer homology domain-containing protein [Selenomonas sp.]
MKKTLVSALTTALVVGAASTTFAAANPFSDVPADHWAYDAVSQLAADGVIEGYGDSTFKGNRNITRYEMAQMVAKAMAKNTSGADKALVDKLAAEFAAELNNLGVRVANLERNADMVKWNGTAEYTFTRYKTGDNDEGKNTFLFRLEPSAEVNNNWHVKARLDATNNAKTDDEQQVSLKRIWAEGKYNNVTIKLGKFATQDDDTIADTPYSGAEVSYAQPQGFNAVIGAGRLDTFEKGVGVFNGRYGSNHTAAYGYAGV